MDFIVIIIMACSAAYALYLLYELRKRKRKLRLVRFLDLVQQYEDQIQAALSDLEALLADKGRYIQYQECARWSDTHGSLYRALHAAKHFLKDLPEDQSRIVDAFLDLYRDAHDKRAEHNEKYIARELEAWHDLLSNIEGRSLDAQQRRSVVVHEKNQLVIAGAGSGKTTTIVGKVEYLLQRFNMPPDSILLISFTRRAADSLKQRVSVEGVQAKTFHKLGLDIIAAVEKHKPGVFDSSRFDSLLKKRFLDSLTDQKYLNSVLEYFVGYLKPYREDSEFEDHGQYIQYLKDQNLRTLRPRKISNHATDNETLRLEIVKSFEECQIANFLFINGIDYDYEAPYPFRTSTPDYAQYKPDFTIRQGRKVVFLEHFGMRRNGDIPSWFARNGDSYETAREKYHEKRDWARNTHRENGTVLLESYSYEVSEGRLFEALKKKLEDAGLVLKPMSEDALWEHITRVNRHEVESFIKLMNSFIALMRSEDTSIAELRNKVTGIKGKWNRKRAHKFLDICAPLLTQYEGILHERNEIDFTEMINRARKYISSGQYHCPWKYVIVDEFQDVSMAQYRLLKSIVSQNGTKLFCVGDDWQSIYRFRGSDLSIFTRFKDYFGYTETSKIETTYRFGQPLLDISSKFILQNPNQISKRLRNAGSKPSTDIEVIYTGVERDYSRADAALHAIFQEITDKNHGRGCNILVLGRYTSDYRVLENSRFFRINAGRITWLQNENGSRSPEAEFLTVHRAKGLEAEYVILLNCHAGRYGFPNELTDDPIIQLLLREEDTYPNAEERRLFYVAITRATRKTFIVADAYTPSKFLSEWTGDQANHEEKGEKCPYCKSGQVVFRQRGRSRRGKPYDFYGCTNYRYGCDYKRTEWIEKAVAGRSG